MLYTTQQLAALLQIHPESVRRMTRQGRLPTPIKLSATKAGDVRYLKSEIETWLASQKRDHKAVA